MLSKVDVFFVTQCINCFERNFALAMRLAVFGRIHTFAKGRCSDELRAHAVKLSGTLLSGAH